MLVVVVAVMLPASTNQPADNNNNHLTGFSNKTHIHTHLLFQPYVIYYEYLVD